MKLKQCGSSRQHDPVHENEACREERRQLDELRSRSREAYVAHDRWAREDARARADAMEP
eukprot:9158835-Heterocapsa_arctica.AAC.1